MRAVRVRVRARVRVRVRVRARVRVRVRVRARVRVRVRVPVDDEHLETVHGDGVGRADRHRVEDAEATATRDLVEAVDARVVPRRAHLVRVRFGFGSVRVSVSISVSEC